MLLPESSFAKPTRLPPVSPLHVKIGPKNDGIYLKERTWTHYHLSTAANVAFAMLWAAEGRTALRVVTHKMLTTWQAKQQAQRRARETLAHPSGGPQLKREEEEEVVDKYEIDQYVDAFLRRCHQTFPEIEIGKTAANGDMGHVRLQMEEGIPETFDPCSWGVIVLDEEVKMLLSPKSPPLAIPPFLDL